MALSATTEMTMINLVGIGNFGFNANGVRYTFAFEQQRRMALVKALTGWFAVRRVRPA